jgi:hypothetical protein
MRRCRHRRLRCLWHGRIRSKRDTRLGQGRHARDRSQVTSAITALQADFKKYSDDQAIVTSYTPAQPPTESQVSVAVAAARADVPTIHASVSGYFATANKLLTQANGYAAEADAACKKISG